MSSKSEVRTQKFPMMYDRWRGGQLTQAQAAQLLGIGERTFRRWSTRYQGAGLEGVRRGLQRAHGQASPAEVRALATLYREHYRNWNVRHFYEQYREAHGGGRSYKWVSKHLQAAGLVPRGHSNGRRRRNGTRPERSERQARAGALVHQAGRRDEWVEGQRWDLIRHDRRRHQPGLLGAFWRTSRGFGPACTAFGRAWNKWDCSTAWLLLDRRATGTGPWDPAGESGIGPSSAG